jgi:hypothetical protein
MTYGHTYFKDFVSPALSHMEHFRFHTLARILISFVPMIDMMFRNRIELQKIASFGSGTCSHEIFLSTIFKSSFVDCYDVSSSFIPEYNSNYIETEDRISFTESCIEEIDSSKFHEIYDYVFSIQALEHFDDYESAIDNICSTVSKSGYLYIDTPFYSELETQDGQDYIEREHKRQWEKHQHFHLGFSVKDTAKRLSQRGFQVVDYGYSGYREGDSNLLRLLRSTKTQKSKITKDSALGMILLFREMLLAHENSYKMQFDKLDSLPHENRIAYAIRVLARKI